MKIGVLFSAYNCAKYIDECLNPWLELKEELNLVLAATNGRYLLSPAEVGNAKGSESLLKIIGKNIDFLLHSPSIENNWTEEEGRTFMLKYALGQKVDLIWVVDCDEIYTKENIYNILSYIKENPGPDCYNVSFKNYYVKYPYWVNDDFNKAVLYWTDRKKGIDRFCFDCDVAYNDGTMVNIKGELKNKKIDKNIAFINHYSWLQADPRVKDKIQNQQVKYSGKEGARCGYRYDEEDRLVFNEIFYSNRGLQIPCVHQSVVNKSHVCDIIYSRKEERIYLKDITHKGFYFIKIIDEKENIIYSIDLKLIQDYWLAPYNKLSNNASFSIIFMKDGEVVKQEKIYIDFKDY